MANAIALQVDGSVQPNNYGFSADYNCTYAGTDVPNGPDASSVSVTFDFDDTPQNMDDKLGSAVRAEGQRLGYTVDAVIALGYRKV